MRRIRALTLLASSSSSCNSCLPAMPATARLLACLPLSLAAPASTLDPLASRDPVAAPLHTHTCDTSFTRVPLIFSLSLPFRFACGRLRRADTHRFFSSSLCVVRDGETRKETSLAELLGKRDKACV